MTIHLCKSSKKLTWNQIKQSILGRKRLVDEFTCAGCSRSFETICCLHFHCMKHNQGGSYFFDHVTSTAFPKLDTRCSATQFKAEDMNDDGAHKLKVLIGKGRSKDETVESYLSSNNEVNSNIENTEFSSQGSSNENDISDDDSNIEQQVEVTSEKISEENTKKVETDPGKRDRKRVAKVKVRNIEKRDDGSITFEMNETDAHLFQVTANTLIEHIRKMAGDLPKYDQELEVIVPDDLLKIKHSEVSDDNERSNNKSETASDSTEKGISSKTFADTERSNNKTETVSENTQKDTSFPAFADNDHLNNRNKAESVSDSTWKDNIADKQVDLEGDSKKDSEVNQAMEVNFRASDCNKGIGIDKSNETDGRNDMKRSSHWILDQANKPVEMKLETDSDMVNESNKKLKNENKDKNFANESVENDVDKMDYKTRVEKKAKLVHVQKKDNTYLEPHIHTRSQRKRKLTTKMKESELLEIMSLGRKTPRLQEIEKEELTLKKRKTPNFIKVTDFSAGESLLALRETGNLKSVKSSKDRTGLSVVFKNKDTDCIDVIDSDAGKKSDCVENVNEDSDAEKMNDQSPETIMMNDISESKKGCREVYKDEICAGNGEDSEKTKKRVFPKKQRQKRLKAGQTALKKCNDFKCNVCGKVGSLSMLKYHEQMHSDKMPYKCEECGKCFKTAACKRSHMLQHGEKKWKCTECPSAFYRKQYLDVHMTNHTGEYPYVCELCGMKFKMAYIVRRHVNNVHKNIRNYKCDICGKEFFRVATRDQHRNRHFDPFLQCSYCPKKFKGDLDLRKHELTHTGEKMYFCPICNQGFTQIWPYYKHMWKIHNIEKEEAKKIRIRNPDIVNMRNINKDSAKKDQAYVHEFIGKPGCTFDMQKSFNQNVNQLRMMENKSQNYNKMKGISETGLESESNIIYTATEASMSDTIVMNIGDDLDNRETIVIHTEELQTVGDQQTGYIVVENGQADGNIVIYSDLTQNETGDIQEFISNC